MLTCRSISHQLAPLAIREGLDFSERDQIAWLCGLNTSDVVLISTCNRLELYTFGDSDVLWDDLLMQKGTSSQDMRAYTSTYTNKDAARYLFEVAASLHSMALGEAQISGQVAEAFARAERCGRGGHRISMLMRAAIHSAKRIHAETHINQGSVSVSSLGINRVEQALGSLDGLFILVIGAGQMGQAVLKGLHHRGVASHVVSRTYESAQRAAQRWNAQAHEHLQNLLTQADVIFTTSNAPAHTLTPQMMPARDGRPLHIVDIAIPRDVSPQVAALPGVTVYNLDDLGQVIADNHQQRQNAIPQARHIIEEELTAFWEDYQGLAAVPTIQQMRAQADWIRQQELARIVNKLPNRDADELSSLLEEFSQRFMNKLLHHPTHSLRLRAGNGNAALFNAVARDLFGLEDA
jgi:glutamyl-tRNA reductase